MHKPQTNQSTDEWLRAYAGKNVTQIQPSAPLNKTQSQHDDLEEGVVEEKALIPEGEYSAWYSSHELHKNFKGYGDKLVVSFCVDECDHAGEIVSAFYNITITKKVGRLKVGVGGLRKCADYFQPGNAMIDYLCHCSRTGKF